MKRAKVSAVYEGRRGKRSKEENDNDSRIARMHARARKNGLRAKKTQTFVVTERRRRVRSYTKSASQVEIITAAPTKEGCINVKDQEKKLINGNVEIIEIIDDESMMGIAALFEPPQQLVNKVVAEPLRADHHVNVVENYEEGPAWWEELLPMKYRTNYLQTMKVMVNGFGGTGMTEEELWWDDIWNFRDMDDKFHKT